MRVVFRTDASPSIGHGHVRRCLTLASKLREKGVVAEFIVRSGSGNLADQIGATGFQVTEIDVPPSTTSWQEDARQSKKTLSRSENPDWLVVDHYELDQRWERALRESAGRIMVIDDLADRPHDCDLLLDQNLVADLELRYAGKVRDGCGLLLGPRYALLDSKYAQLHDVARVRSGAIKRILVSFGGVDLDNLTQRVLSAFVRAKRSNVVMDIALGASSPHADAIRALASDHANVKVLVGMPSLADLLASADLAIGACGTTTWERLCLGVPSLVITVAPNQEPAAHELNRLGLIRLLGDGSVGEAKIADALESLMNEGLDPAWSERCLAMVDGRGVQRVAAAITVSAETPLSARLATRDDEMLLLEWANDPETRANAFSPERISPATHSTWFRQRLANNSDCRLYIVQSDDGAPLATVRFERDHDTWEVHYSVAQPFRRRGLARRALATALLELRSHEPNARIFGQVKKSNQASRNVFESLGFREVSGPRDGVIAYEIQADSVATLHASPVQRLHANR